MEIIGQGSPKATFLFRFGMSLFWTCLFSLQLSRFVPIAESHSGNFTIRAPSGYDRHMARGWESKAVEEQQSQMNRSKTRPAAPLTAEQKATQHNRDSLTLARRQVVQQLEKASSPRHREMLQRALADLEAQIARLC
jgi:hypothetical protein